MKAINDLKNNINEFLKKYVERSDQFLDISGKIEDKITSLNHSLKHCKGDKERKESIKSTKKLFDKQSQILGEASKTISRIVTNLSFIKLGNENMLLDKSFFEKTSNIELLKHIPEILDAFIDKLKKPEISTLHSERAVEVIEAIKNDYQELKIDKLAKKTEEMLAKTAILQI